VRQHGPTRGRWPAGSRSSRGTRGAGRGIARALGEAGATVYCTGRSVRGRPSPYHRPETIDETAAMIAGAGGRAVALRVDHTVEREVEALVARIVEEQGRLDVLVNRR
jgi:NAD(P)-dependent dehydrogenase (short-subunit alcohol dehydrogenase family)